MASSLNLSQDRVRLFLRNLPGLSRPGRNRLYAVLHDSLGNHGDFFRNDPQRRLSPGSPFFWFDFVMQDRDGDGRLHHFRFVVSDRDAQYGILHIEFAEEL